MCSFPLILYYVCDIECVLHYNSQKNTDNTIFFLFLAFAVYYLFIFFNFFSFAIPLKKPYRSRFVLLPFCSSLVLIHTHLCWYSLHWIQCEFERVKMVCAYYSLNHNNHIINNVHCSMTNQVLPSSFMYSSRIFIIVYL